MLLTCRHRGHRYIATRDEKMDSLCKAKVWTVESGRNNWKQISSKSGDIYLARRLV